MVPATLILEDKSEFHGYCFGGKRSTAGEVVFNTGMVGYPEAMTDPSYRGQILTFTYPLIGNYGVPGDEYDTYKIHKYFESKEIQPQGIVVSEYSKNYNHWNAKKSLSDWMKEYGIPGITGIDTRSLTQKLREKGAMLGKIVVGDDKAENVDFYNPNTVNMVKSVSIKKPIIYKAGYKKVVILDCGIKNNILREFLKRNVTVIQVPWNYNFFNRRYKFHGLFVGNGPGDPSVVKETQELMRKTMDKNIPTFGICLGSQIMGIAAGAKTYKLKYGHRGQNQPVIDLETKRCYITSQNHGFAVDAGTLPKDWKLWMINANDNTVEGIKHKKLPFFSVQFHPEAHPGPTDMNMLFDQFIKTL